MQYTGSRFLGLKCLFANRFLICCGTFKGLLEYKRMVRSYFTGGVSEHGDMQKGSFQIMVIGEEIAVSFVIPLS